MTKRLGGLLRRLPRQSQRGFTLIEMLVVISILGILAAVVTMSMVGVTNLAQSRADAAELKTVQVALDTMANEQQLDSQQICTGAATSSASGDMANFPVAKTDSQPPTGTAAALYPRYLRQSTTHRSYTCDASGVVAQH